MSEIVDNDSAASSEDLDGQRLLDEGRAARSERARARTLKSRLLSMLGEHPAWMRGAIIGALAVVALAVLLVVGDIAISFGRIHPGVRVADVKVGAHSPGRAAEVIEDTLGPRLEEPLVLTFEEQSWTLDASTVAATLDTAELTEEAMAIGRTGGVWERMRTRAALWVEPYTVPVTVDADDELLDGFLSAIALELDRDPVDAAVVIEGTEARLESAAVGLSVRSADVARDVLGAFPQTEHEVPVAIDFLPVKVTDDGAQKALDDARAMLDGPVVVAHGEKAWQFEQGHIAEWIAFRTVPDAGASAVGTETAAASATGAAAASTGSAEATVPPAAERFVLEAYISADEASATIAGVVGEAGSPAVDARFEVGGGNVTIVPSQDGVGPDIEALAVEMTRVLTTTQGREVELRTERVEPELTTERAQQMGIKERIATYTTNFSSANRQRVSNIHTLAAALDGTLVPPGGTFSFNDTIGPRTAAKGYQEAPAIIGGRLVPSLGGGICQVATTLFNTVFDSGLAVVERRNHSFYISSYPKGRDATVSWGGVDFKFKNDTDNWVLIATAYSNTSVTVSLYGTDPGYDVRSTTGEFTDIRPHPVKEVMDDQLAEGFRVIEDAGVDGRRVTVKRTVTKSGSLVREDNFTSVYQPKEETVRVGTKKETGSTTPTATVTP